MPMMPDKTAFVRAADTATKLDNSLDEFRTTSTKLCNIWLQSYVINRVQIFDDKAPFITHLA